MSDRHSQFLRIFLQSQASIAAFVHTVVRDRSAADDIVQEVALTLWAEFDRYDTSRPFVPWARGVAANMMLRHFKQQSRGASILSPEAVMAVLEASNQDGGTSASQRHALRICLGDLPERSQVLVRLRYAGDLTFDDIAARVGSTGEAVRKAISRLRESLRACVEKRAALLARGSGQ